MQAGEDHMKIIISAGSRKRQIDGPLALCGTRADLLSLAAQIMTHFDENLSVTYGWVDICDRAPVLTNTPATPWDEL